ncbi:unnamed protein product, partial [Schistosoma mattheei]
MPIKRSSGRLGPIGGGVNNNTRRACEQMVSSVPLVKHSTFPVVPKLSHISFLSLSLMLCLTSTLTQHIDATIALPVNTLTSASDTPYLCKKGSHLFESFSTKCELFNARCTVLQDFASSV